MPAIGWFGEVAIDCPDPWALANFYRELVGGEPEGDDEWVTLRSVPLAFQRADEWAPPIWPGAERPQQAHIDLGKKSSPGGHLLDDPRAGPAGLRYREQENRTHRRE